MQVLFVHLFSNLVYTPKYNLDKFKTLILSKIGQNLQLYIYVSCF